MGYAVTPRVGTGALRRMQHRRRAFLLNCRCLPAVCLILNHAGQQDTTVEEAQT